MAQTSQRDTPGVVESSFMHLNWTFPSTCLRDGTEKLIQNSHQRQGSAITPERDVVHIKAR
jgi:hypothetical protein